MKTANSMYLEDKQLSLFDTMGEDVSDLGKILKKLSGMARDSETQRKLRSCVYQGFEEIVGLAEGNIGIYVDFLSRMWENARISGEISPNCRVHKLLSRFQVDALWNFSNYRFSTIESGIQDDGIYISNLVNNICESFEKGTFASRAHATTHDIEIPPRYEIEGEAIDKLKKGFQCGVFVPVSSAGYYEIPQSFNLSKFYLPKWGLINSKCHTFELNAEKLNEWATKSPEIDITPTRRGQKIKPIDEHLGFLSISFRKEEPASTARKMIQELFDNVKPQIKCFDVEKFGKPIGSEFLLKKIREGIYKDATFCLIEASNITPNVMVEFGLTKGLRKLFWLLIHKDKIGIVPEWVGGLRLIPYSFEKSDEDTLEHVITNKVIEELKPITGKIEDFCPIKRGMHCPNVVTKDLSKVFISYPEHDDIWQAATQDLKDLLSNKLGYRLIVAEDSLVEPTSHQVCYWCYAIRSSGIVFVDTTPSTKQESTIEKIGNDPTQCFILGLAFGQRQKKRTHCVHLFKSGVGKEITLWKGYPQRRWTTKEDIIKAVRNEVEKVKERRIKKK